MTTGVPAGRLSDEDLRHDLLQLKKKQADIEAGGTLDQQANHRDRTAELEAEFVARFGSASPDEPSAAEEPEESGGAESAREAGSDF